MYSSTKIISEAVCVCACVSSEKNISSAQFYQSAHTAAAWANNHQGGQGRHPQRQEPEAARGKKKVSSGCPGDWECMRPFSRR